MTTAGAQPPTRRGPGLRLARIGVALGLIALVGWGGHWLAMQRGLQALREAGVQRLELAATRIDAQLARFDFLPALLQTSPEVMRLFDTPADATLAATVNHYLNALNAIAGADNLYVMDRQGRALAAADHASPGTPVGRDLSYRPYVVEALATGRGRFYGVGVTSARAGYYLSFALPASGPVRGLATVEVDLADIENEWTQLPGQVLMLDEHQVAILATRADWRYRALAPLGDAARAEVQQSRRYGAVPGAELQSALMAHPWPGNVRELRNVADRFVLGLMDTDTLRLRAEQGARISLPEQLEQIERVLVSEGLRRAQGDISAAAQALGVPKQTLYDKLKRLQIDAASFRAEGRERHSGLRGLG